jgi:serine phosphatase RsbU (regulator of sigma subunit)
MNIIEMGHHVIDIITTGESALEMAPRYQPDLILTDIHLEGKLNGLKTAELLWRRYLYPIIFITADTSEETLSKARKSKPLGYVLKPINLNVLRNTIETAAYIIELQRKVLHKNKVLEEAYAKITEQKQRLENTNSEIQSSIRYAAKIQSNVLNQKAILKASLGNIFLYNKPKDTISGDFAWFSQVNTFSYFGVFDCTGHGIPAGLITILANTFLNEAVKELHHPKPDEILYCVEEKLARALSDSGTISSNDGMAASLCRFDNQTHELIFSGARQSMQIIQNEIFKQIDGEKFYIGIDTNTTKKFINHSFHIQHGDTIYLFTDGYIDQFGGIHGKRFMNKRLMNLLSEIYRFNPDQQQLIIDTTMSRWQFDNEQNDDIMALGIKF